MKVYLVTAGTLVALASSIQPLVFTALAQSGSPRVAVGGFNVLSVTQDIEVGRQSAAVAQSQLAFLGVKAADQYANKVVKRLAKDAPGGKYPYAVRILNGSDIYAFSLPGGPIYLNRGLVEATRSEAELAAVIAHEMGHIAMRHGTANISKSYLGKKGMGLLGGFGSTPGISASTIVKEVGGMGLNAIFLNFSRDDENEADRVGSEILAEAGYAPSAMLDLLSLFRESNTKDPDKIEMYFGSHPPAAAREARVRTFTASLKTKKSDQIGGYARLATLMAAKPYSSAASGILPAPVSTPNPPLAMSATPAKPLPVVVPAPSARLTNYRQPTGYFTVSFPDNWGAVQAPGHFAATVAPAEGFVPLPDGQKALVYGIIIDHYHPFEGIESRWDAALTAHYTPFDNRVPPRGTLEDATDDLVRTVLRSNVYLKAVAGSVKPSTDNGVTSYSMILSGISPITGVEERVKVYTRMLPDNHVLFALGVAPVRDFDAMDIAFTRLTASLVIDEDEVHSAKKGSRKP